MKEIYFEDIAGTVKNLCIEANLFLPEDVKCAECKAYETERNRVAKEIFSVMADNTAAAAELSIPICQDTGMAVVFLESGRDVHFNCDIREAVDEGVRRGYRDGYLRLSVVRDPIRRGNTGDNTPSIIYQEIVAGDNLKITVAPKGFGSENMSAIKMFNPTATEDDIIEFIVQTVKSAGANPCPPIVLGVGIGGDFEYSAFLAKKALTRDLNLCNPDPFYREMEQRTLREINSLGIGPQGLGGDTTALGVNILTYPTHIAGLPVAVNVGCHVNRHKSITL